MEVAVFSSKPYDREFLARHAGQDLRLTFLEPRLQAETASLAAGHRAVCLFVHDVADRAALEKLHAGGCRLIALRCAGFNHVDLKAAADLGLTVVRVPAYSPHAVAEFAAGLLMTLNRRLHRAYNRVREGNFSLDGLLGFDLHNKTVGVVGTGKIGLCFIRIMQGFGCRVIASDPYPAPELGSLGATLLPLDEVLGQSDILSLHCPLTPETKHLINPGSLELLKPGVILVNTSRGALIDTPAAIDGIKNGRIGGLALDVYEEEEGIFYEDLSGSIVGDDVLMRLLTFPNVLITSHQAFFTREAMENIASTTVGNVREFASTGRCSNAVRAD